MSDHSHRQVAIYPGVLPFRCSPSRRQDMHMTTRLNAFPTPSIYPVWAIINFVISIHLRMPLFWAMSPALFLRSQTRACDQNTTQHVLAFTRSHA
jgi:hypothetical protein